jgi:regulator of sigma E protease
MTLIYFILVLGIVIFIHELGHFLFAKKAGIYVYEFSLGMGPKLFGFKRKNDETAYNIRLFPIGGFVQMAGEEIEADKNIPENKRMQAKSWLQKFMVFIAGVLFNFILAFLIFLFLGIFNGSSSKETYIGEVANNSAAEIAGLKENQELISLNGKKITSASHLAVELEVNYGKIFHFVVKDNDVKKEISVKPVKIEEDEKISYSYGFSYVNHEQKGFINAIKYAFNSITSLFYEMFLVIAYLFSGTLSLNNLAGPIGIYNIVGQAASFGIASILSLIALLCVNVGFINILPIPAFDGGRLLFLVIEKLRGKPMKAKTENIIHAVFFFLLMLLMIVITFNDIMRLFK